MADSFGQRGLAASLATLLFWGALAPAAAAQERAAASADRPVEVDHVSDDNPAEHEGPKSQSERLGSTERVDVGQHLEAAKDNPETDEATSADGEASSPTPAPLALPSGPAKSAVTPQAIALPKGEGSIQGM